MTVYEGRIKVSSPFGPRTNPITGAANSTHKGKDMVGLDSKTLRMVCAKGKVLQVNLGYQGGRGNNVLIQVVDDIVRPGADVRLRYQHLALTPLKAGQTLALCDVVGTEGSTGDSTGSHCHFEVTVNGAAVDPSPWDGLPNVAGNYLGNNDVPGGAPPEENEKEPAEMFDQMILQSFGEKNMQGFSRPDSGGQYLVYDHMPVGNRVTTRTGIAGMGEGAQWTWVELRDERNGTVIYTPLISDRNVLLDGPVFLPPAQGAADGWAVEKEAARASARDAKAAAGIVDKAMDTLMAALGGK